MSGRTEASSSSGGPPSGTEADALGFFPAGLELLHGASAPLVTSPNHAFFLAVHWALIRAGFRRTRTPQLKLEGTYEVPKTDAAAAAAIAALPIAQLTETPEDGWAEKISSFAAQPVHFQYLNPLAPHEGFYDVEFYSLGKDCIVRVTNPHCPASRERYLSKKSDTVDGKYDPKDTQAASFTIGDYIHFGPDFKVAIEIYYNAAELERRIFVEILMELGLRVLGNIPKSIGLYDDKSTASSQSQQQGANAQQQRRGDYGMDYDDPRSRRPMPMPNPGGIGGPLYVPPVGGGGLGRSDLDPLGRLGAGGGMLADPRGFRRPQTGPAGIHPPGARFDPFGPVGPNPLPGPMPRGPPGPGQFGPDPDHERPPPGLEDMFM